MVAVFSTFSLLLLYITPNLHAKLIHLTSEAALNALPYGLILSYKNSTGSQLYTDFVEKSNNFVELLCQNFAHFNYLDFRCFKVDCNNIDQNEKIDQYVKYKFCRKHDTDENDMEFVKFTLFNSIDDLQLALEPLINLESRAYLRLLFKFFSREWSNVHFWSSMDIFKDWLNMGKNLRKKLFLCYGQPEHILGSTFCYQLASMYRKNSEINILIMENLENLAQFTFNSNLKIDVNALRPMFGFWFIDCLSLNVDDCRSVRYLADDSVDRVHLFIKMIFMKNPVSMTKLGAIPDIGPVPGPLVYLVHRTASISRIDHLSRKLIDTLKGLAFIVTVNIDELEVDVGELSTLNQNGIKCKFKPRSVDDNGEIVELEGVDIDNLDAIADFVINWYKRQFNLEHLFEQTKDQNLQFQALDKAEEDDEEDNILRELNPKTNVDIKQQLISIERDNFEHFLESKPIALIVYWLNVDSTSLGVLYIVSQALKILNSKRIAAAHVPCHVWLELCEDVNQYPQIRIYRQASPNYLIYNGIYEQYLIADWLIILQEPQLEEIFDTESLNKKIELSNGKNLKFYIVGCFRNENIDLYRKLADELSGQFIFKWTKDRKCLNQDSSKTDKIMIYNLSILKFEKQVLIVDELTTLDRMKSFVIESLRPPQVEFNAINYIIIRKIYDKFYLIISPQGQKSALFSKLRSSIISEAVFVLNSSRDTNLARKILKTQNFYLTDFDFLIRYDKSNDADQQFLSILCSNCSHEIDYLSNTKFDNENVAIVKSRYEKEEL